MTAEPRRSHGLGPLGRRLLAAFVLVALSSVAVLTVAALVGTERGLVTAAQEQRQQAADRAGQAVAAAYTAAGGDWAGADLSQAQAVADSVGGNLVVRDSSGNVVATGRGRGAGLHAPATVGAQAPVNVDGRQIGTVELRIRPAPSAGRTVAWSWIASAAVVALLIALAVSWYVSGRLAGALVRLAAAARAFAAGDRAARSGVRPPGELGDLAVAFDTMAEEVVRSERVRRQLAADVAHELRTPLAALQAGLEELRDGLREPDPARLASLHDQALRLGRVVGDLAELSAAESAVLSLRHEELDLSQIVAAALDGQEPRLRAAELSVIRDLPRPVPVRGDSDRLHQAISNLLANAARYCRPGDQVSVRVWRAGGQAVTQVADTGPGIAPDDLPHVFERLWRGPGAASVTGSGIGLAVVRELVAAHGGTISADSPPGGGAVFTVRLPASHVAAADRPR